MQHRVRAGLGPAAVDEHGKAIFGCPGPGAYQWPSQFNLDPSCPPEGRSGKHVFARDGAFTIKGRSKISEWRSDSPGPAAHVPVYGATDKSSHPAPFGKSQRSTEARRFISRRLAGSDGSEVPGPGAYRYRTGKGHSRTIGDAPHAVMGTGSRPPINAAADPDIPGAKYNVPGAFDLRHGTRIAPLNSRERGLARDRASEAQESWKLYFGPGKGAPAGTGDGPSPTAYSPDVLAMSAAHARAPDYSFSKAVPSAADRVRIKVLTRDPISLSVWHALSKEAPVSHMSRRVYWLAEPKTSEHVLQSPICAACRSAWAAHCSRHPTMARRHLHMFTTRALTWRRPVL